jgi:zinc transport system substrate-binding protein
VVAVSIYPVADWVREVAGDAVRVVTILPPGANPHTFEPTARTAEEVERASLRVVIGLGLDDWALKLSAPRATTLVLSEGVATVESAPDEPGEEAGPNPHVWMDPVRAAEMVGKLVPALGAVAPAEKAAIEARAQAYQVELRALGEELPVACRRYKGRQIVTMHNAYDYLLGRCGLAPARVVTHFAGQEPSAAYLEELALWARKNQVQVIFGEMVLSPKAAQVLAQEIHGQVLLLDDLGNPDDAERSSYVKLIRWDLQELLKGLGEG